MAVSSAAVAAHAQQASGSWAPVAWVSAEAAAEPGVTIGGEGGQWPRSIAIDGDKGRFVLHGTDVGGLFRTLDGGDTWEPANVGYEPRGTCGLAIDPRNPDRCLSIGANSTASESHGVWLSTDRAASWRHVFPAPISASQDFRSQVSYDAASYDEAVGFCTDAYWSRIRNDKPMFGEVDSDPALYRTGDGGESWERIEGSEAYAGGHLATHPARRGTLYVTHPGGLSVSRDRGGSFERLLDGEFTGVAVSPDRPGAVWVSHAGGLRISDDGGATWADSPMSGGGIDGRTGVVYEQPTVSPADSNRVAVRSRSDNWQWRLHVSHDGGRTFHSAGFDNTNAFFPHNARHWIVAWNPADPDVAHTFGGDWSTRSTDGGRTFAWASNGLNEVMVGGAFHFNPGEPDAAYLTAQDYNGALTTDGGETWNYVNASGEGWGGMVYGGYAVDADTLIAGHSADWSGGRRLKVSRDGGETFEAVADASWNNAYDAPDRFGMDSSFADPRREGVWFAGPYRTDNAGETWGRMNGCHGVLAARADALYGVHQRGPGDSAVVVSRDGGESWTPIAEVEADVWDVAPEVGGDAVYFVAWGTLSRIPAGGGEPERLNVPENSRGGTRVTSVATDPNRPGRVYATQTMNVHRATASAMVSEDGGESWAVLTRGEPLDGEGLDGGNEATWVRVHPKTGDAWFATGCYGVWRWTPGD